MINLAELL